jgi:hypothetical protein
MSTADLSLVLSALAVAVSGGTLVVTYKLGIRRFDHERELDDRGDARSTLAEGALELGRMKVALMDALTGFTRPLETGEGWPDDFDSEIGKLETAVEALQSALAVVRIRFKPGSDVVVELDLSMAMAQSLKDLYIRAKGSGVAGGKRRDPREEQGRDDYSKAMKLTLEFDLHRDGYLAAAQGVVGVDLADHRPRQRTDGPRGA